MKYKKYLRGYTKYIWLAAFLIYLFFAALITLKLLNPETFPGNEEHDSALKGAAVLYFCMIMILLVFISRIKERIKIKQELIKKGQGPEFIEKDFETSQKFFDDTIRVGRCFLFIKKFEHEISFDTIVRAQRLKSTVIKNDHKNEYWSLLFSEWSSDLKPCRLPSYTNEEWDRFAEVLSFAAPDIKIEQSVQERYY